MMTTPNTRTILLIEDDPHDRALVKRLLKNQRRQYVIHEATSGAQGLTLCREVRPDCILLDYYLPDMDGREWLATYSRESGRRSSLPVAMLTGRDDDDLAIATLEMGAQDYLVKDGLSSHGLTRAIENAVEKCRIRRELEEQRAAIELRNHKLEVLRDELQTKLVELADATKAKDRFLAVMSHEMRTPLNAILGYADLLDMELDGELEEGQRQQVDRIRFGSRHLLDLINDLLDLARLDARRLDLDVRAVDLGAVIEEVTALLEAQALGKGITLEAEPCGADVPHVLADLQRLRQILTNLVGNAIKFTEQGSITIRCESKRRDGLVSVIVQDTGIGIAPESLPLVFTEFYQADDELTRRRGGSGLGLAIAQRLAQLMGGHISADSELGNGSTFTIFLRPAEAGSRLRQDDVDSHGDRMAARIAGMSMADRRRALVPVVAFGENATALADLQERVRGSVRLVWTTKADEVPEITARERASLVIVDVGSAGAGGWRAALALQEVPELASTAVLLLPSIPAPSGDETEGLDLGWVSLVPKPFTAEQLTRAVTAAAEESNDEPATPPRPFDVLVVDDDPDSRRVAAKFLSEANVTVREAQDGETALVEMRSHPPDVLVLDLMMPVLDGFGVLATIRADPLLAGLPVVVLTAKSLTEAERQFLSRSAVRVLQKGEHRLADVAALVLRAAMRAGGERRRSPNADETVTESTQDSATVVK
jgi:signal transduction histidine kinase